ncbi:Uma2 family endonuclease [Leptolyngbya sp. ST-U4]|uniref:Uma2 family endonuclease n=1 Tax=Leptolyngbya sp. ST-U4 TaxID=2933912 RepID=UPI003297E168
MVNPVPILQTIALETWIPAAWEDFLTFADDPTLVGGRFYYDQGEMRIEMSPLGSAHGQDNSIVLTVVNLYATVKAIPIKSFINTTFRKAGLREFQPDLAFYIGEPGEAVTFPARSNAAVDLNEFDPPSLVIEIVASSLEDDCTRKQPLYQRAGIREYWVVDVNVSQVIAVEPSKATQLRRSQVLPGLEIDWVDSALKRAQTEDDGAVSRWFLGLLTQ